MTEHPDPRMRLLELDHQNAVRITDTSLRSLGVVRGWAVTAWLALVAAALEFDNEWIALLSIAPLVVFGLHDGYLSWAYRAAMEHARRVERVWQAIYDAAGRGESDERVAMDAETKAQAHALGAILEFPRFRAAPKSKFLPASQFAYVYLLLALCSAGVALALLLCGSRDADRAHTRADTTPTVAEGDAFEVNRSSLDRRCPTVRLGCPTS